MLEAISEESAKTIGKELLASNRSLKLKLGGYSMYPTLLPNDLATVEPIELSQLRKGQIVVFEQNEKWLAHRLVRVKNKIYTTQGDSILKPDASLAQNQLIGVITEVWRDGKKLQLSQSAAWFFTRFRPFPQILSRLLLKVRNRLRKLNLLTTKHNP